ncbi:MAG: hypothetical protein ABW000_02530 [Actinoplanes sp.]
MTLTGGGTRGSRTGQGPPARTAAEMVGALTELMAGCPASPRILATELIRRESA